MSAGLGRDVDLPSGWHGAGDAVIPGLGHRAQFHEFRQITRYVIAKILASWSLRLLPQGPICGPLRYLRFPSFAHASTATGGGRQSKRKPQITQRTAKRRKGSEVNIADCSLSGWQGAGNAKLPGRWRQVQLYGYQRTTRCVIAGILASWSPGCYRVELFAVLCVVCVVCVFLPLITHQPLPPVADKAKGKRKTRKGPQKGAKVPSTH
jgi:hypothetical protein